MRRILPGPGGADDVPAVIGSEGRRDDRAVPDDGRALDRRDRRRSGGHLLTADRRFAGRGIGRALLAHAAETGDNWPGQVLAGRV
ncbi:hypothetical protein [Streptomyces sp. NPDC018059]|uniref:hypothetical protein n=1 Tax=Streptomyces sp. NPDC018059 TaxID=3365041 RepID=UPI00378D3303